MSAFKISIQYGDKFRETVADGTADPYTGIRLVAGDVYLYGNTDRWPKNWVTYIANSLLESLPPIADGEKSVITNHNGPSYLVLEPQSETSVQFTHVFRQEGVKEPSERLQDAPSASIELHSLIEESIRSGEELRDEIVEIRPDLDSHEDLQLLSSNIERAKIFHDLSHISKLFEPI